MLNNATAPNNATTLRPWKVPAGIRRSINCCTTHGLVLDCRGQCPRGARDRPVVRENGVMLGWRTRQTTMRRVGPAPRTRPRSARIGGWGWCPVCVGFYRHAGSPEVQRAFGWGPGWMSPGPWLLPEWPRGFAKVSVRGNGSTPVLAAAVQFLRRQPLRYDIRYPTSLEAGSPTRSNGCWNPERTSGQAHEADPNLGHAGL